MPKGPRYRHLKHEADNALERRDLVRAEELYVQCAALLRTAREEPFEEIVTLRRLATCCTLQNKTDRAAEIHDEVSTLLSEYKSSLTDRIIHPQRESR